MARRQCGVALIFQTEAIDFNLGTGSPGGGVGSDNFSVRWDGYIEAPATGAYLFETLSDDGIRVWVNGQLLINNWTGHPPAADRSAPIALTGGQRYAIRVEFFEGGGGALLQLRWQVPGSGERTLVYDVNGNLLNDGAGRTCSWDALNRLASVTLGGETTSFAYDGAGRRVLERLNGSEIRRWVYGSGPQPIEERNAANQVTKRFYAGLGEQIGSEKYFYTTDHLGSVREMTDWSGNIRARYDYDPYGKLTKLSGDMESAFGFTGFYKHAASGLNLTLYRAYDAELGRWISRDPIGENGGINLYGYVGNNPVNAVDMWGLSTDKYVPDVDKHGAPHIDRYTKNGQNVGRYRIDGSPVKHRGVIPSAIPNSDKRKFLEASNECKRKIKLRNTMLHTTADEALQVLAIMDLEGTFPSPSTSETSPQTPSTPSHGGSGGTIIYNGKTYSSQNGVLSPVP